MWVVFVKVDSAGCYNEFTPDLSDLTQQQIISCLNHCLTQVSVCVCGGVCGRACVRACLRGRTRVRACVCGVLSVQSLKNPPCEEPLGPELDQEIPDFSSR